MKVYGAIDLNQNELKQSVIQNLATDPASGVDGQIYYNTTDHKLKYYDANASAWKSVGADISTYVKSMKANGVDLADSDQNADLKNMSGFDATLETQMMFVERGVFSLQLADFADGRYF